MVDTDNGDGSSAISSVPSRSQGSGGLLEQQRRNLPVTPPRGPLDRVPSEPLMKETEEYASVPESPVSPAATGSVELVRLNDESANDDSRFSDDDNLDQETSQSLLPLSQNMDIASSIAESSQSIIPHSEEPKHEKHDLVEVRTQTRGSRIYTSVGRVKLVRPGGYVKLYRQKYYFRVIRNFTRRWALMISNDTQSPSEDSISQSY